MPNGGGYTRKEKSSTQPSASNQPLTSGQQPAPNQSPASGRQLNSSQSLATDQQPDLSRPTNPNQKLTFRSENIGQWASKQEGLFAEQNRKAAEKKAAREAALKKALPYIKIGGIVVACVATVGLIFLAMYLAQIQPELPNDLTLGSAGAAQVAENAKNVYTEQLQKFYNRHGDNEAGGTVDNPSEEAEAEALAAMSAYFDSQKNRTDDESVKIDLSIIEMQEYSYKGKPEEIIRIGESLNFEEMSELQKMQVWGLLSDAYFSIHDYDNGNRYFDLVISSDMEEDDEAQ